MELSTELFEQIAAALSGAQVPASAPAPAPASAPAGSGDGDAEKRRAARINLSADVDIVPHGVASARPRKVKLLSLSRSGAAVLDWASMQAGEKIVLHLPKPGGGGGGGGGGVVPVVCIVRNTRISGGQFRLGVQFLSRAEQCEPQMLRGVDGIIGRAASSDHVDVIEQIALNGVDPTRAGREHRVNVDVQALMSTYENDMAGAMRVVTVRDISPGGGVCILDHEEMKRDDQFVLQIPRRGGGKPLTILCTVADCRRLDDAQFRIGARFDSRVTPVRRPAKDDHPGVAGFITRLRRWFAA